MHPARTRTTVLVVDDHVPFRAFARDFLAQIGYAVVGEAGDGRSAIAAARDLRPDVVLLDVQLPDLSGFEVARQLAALARPPAVVLISTRERGDYGSQVASSGARGFVSKSQLSAATVRALIG